jgi:voltage-dependent calcium channel L type alpha-1S
MAYNLSEKQSFEVFMAICIITNTILLALDKYPVNEELNNNLEFVNIVFTIIFSSEMIIKMLAVGIKNYFKGSMFNIFDCGIIVASLVDIFLSNLLVNS